MTRYAKLSHNKHVQWSVQFPRDLKRGASLVTVVFQNGVGSAPLAGNWLSAALGGVQPVDHNLSLPFVSHILQHSLVDKPA